MRRRCRYRPAGIAATDADTADVVRRLRGLLAIVTRPPAQSSDPVGSDDELLDQL